MAPNAATATKEPENGKALQKSEGTVSERFTNAVLKEFAGVAGTALTLTPLQKKLAQHLFLKIDATLNELEKKRLSKDKPGGSAIAWANINMTKLATDAVHRIELGLDALIPNHISPIPYYNSKLQKYDLDLRIGYAGKDMYKREYALDKPKDIIYELVYDTDHFKPIKKSLNVPVESYEFEIKNPFKRGNIIGGFGYIVYDDPTKNMLVLVTEEDFLKSKGKAQSDAFWKDYPAEMRMKTIVIRTTDKLKVDPAKVNESFAAVEKDDREDAAIVAAEIEENENTGPVLELPADVVDVTDRKPEDPAPVEDTKKEEWPEKPQEQTGAGAPHADELFGKPQEQKKKGPGY